MQKKPQNQTASDFIRRLPLHRQLNASQAMLIKLSPAWLDWAHQTLPNGATLDCQLNALQNNKLSIVCKNSTLATLIKNQQQRLLLHFHGCGFNDVHEIIVRLRPPSVSVDDNDLNQNTRQHDVSNQQNHFVAASDDSLKAIESCRKMIRNEELSEALARLADTLKSSKTTKKRN